MAVFLLNICKFNGCGITFPSLSDLITHIEDTHIDYDPKVVEQKEQSQPACLPLSYVLRFISDDARKDAPFISANPAGVELKRKLAIKHHSYSMSSSNRSNTPTGSEMDDDEMVVTESEDSNESWTTEEFSSEFIMRYGSRHSGNGNAGTPGNEKPFACPVPGCKKRYKNVNGIKYHSKNGHKKDGNRVRKGYKCHCGKSYKTAQGLKNHALLAHNSTSESAAISANANGNVNVNSSGGAVIVQRSSSPSQSLGSLSPSSISNMSSSASSCHGSNGTHNGTNTAVLHQLTTNTGSINLPQQLMNTTALNNNNSNANTSNNNQHLISNGISQSHNSMHTNAHAQHHAIVTTSSAQTTGNIPINNNSHNNILNNNNSLNNNNLVRNTIGLVSIKSNSANIVGKTTAATNLLAANAAASKILKLATAAAAANNSNNNTINNINNSSNNHSGTASVVIEHKHMQHHLQQHHHQHQQQSQQQYVSNNSGTKITLPSLVNLGILTPATSPTKTIQTITFNQPQQQQSLVNSIVSLSTANVMQQQQQTQKIQISGNAVNSNTTSNMTLTASNKNILIVEQSAATSTQQQRQHQQQQQNQEQTNLPLTPISPKGNVTAQAAVTTVATPASQQQKLIITSNVATATMTNALANKQQQQKKTKCTRRWHTIKYLLDYNNFNNSWHKHKYTYARIECNKSK